MILKSTTSTNPSRVSTERLDGCTVADPDSLAGLGKQEKQKLHLGSNASESSHHVTCQSQCSLEIAMRSNKHVLDRNTHEILAQKYLTDFFQLFKATLSREWKNKLAALHFWYCLRSCNPEQHLSLYDTQRYKASSLYFLTSPTPTRQTRAEG